MAGYCVELPLLGRRGTLSIFTGMCHARPSRKRGIHQVTSSDHRCVHSCVDDGTYIERTAWVELCVQLHEQRDVRRVVCGHARAVPNEGPRHRECHRCECESCIRYHGECFGYSSHHGRLGEVSETKLTGLGDAVGTYHCIVRQPEHVRADLGGWCDIHRSRVHCIVVAIRTSWKGRVIVTENCLWWKRLMLTNVY